jgi:UDP-N-acetylmuramoyl-tripeptide--D-alanyl-D-alanine ligase
MARLSLADIARATGGEVTLGTGSPRDGAERWFEGYSIDSRTVAAGELFFALVGPRHDGHAFIRDAVGRGAAAVVAGRGAGTFPEAPVLVRVADTTRALQDLGAHVRRRRPLKVVGITGSAGKTTAKELAAAVAARRFRTFKSEGNLNNTYGLPLMLLRMPDDCEVAVLEMGMSYHGEITRLVEIADPDVGVILTVLRVHLEHFGSVAEIARAKGELFRGMRRDATAIYNADNRPAAALGRAFEGPSLPYGMVSRRAQVRAEEVTFPDLDAARFVLRHGDSRTPIQLHLGGRHNVYNALAAASVGFALGVDPGAIAAGLAAARPAPMRGVLHRLPNGVALLDDSYNSNPAAMEAAITLLREARPRGRRILAAGDMLELGPYGSRAHRRLGEQAARADLDLFVAAGPLCALAAEAARGAGARLVRHFDDSAAAAAFLAGEVRDGDLVLVKGSRGARMERVVQAIRAAAGVGETGGAH